MRRMNASEFKAKCLGILDEIAATGEPVLILKRGRPIAQVAPVVAEGDGVPQHSLRGTVHVHGDIVGPVLDPDEWEANLGR